MEHSTLLSPVPSNLLSPSKKLIFKSDYKYSKDTNEKVSNMLRHYPKQTLSPHKKKSITLLSATFMKKNYNSYAIQQCFIKCVTWADLLKLKTGRGID
jgi:hypothetical protein